MIRIQRAFLTVKIGVNCPASPAAAVTGSAMYSRMARDFAVRCAAMANQVTMRESEARCWICQRPIRGWRVSWRGRKWCSTWRSWWCRHRRPRSEPEAIIFTAGLRFHSLRRPSVHASSLEGVREAVKDVHTFKKRTFPSLASTTTLPTQTAPIALAVPWHGSPYRYKLSHCGSNLRSPSEPPLALARRLWVRCR